MLYKIKVWRTFHRKDTTQIQNTKIKIKVFCPKDRNRTCFLWGNETYIKNMIIIKLPHTFHNATFGGCSYLYSHAGMNG